MNFRAIFDAFFFEIIFDDAPNLEKTVGAPQALSNEFLITAIAVD